MGRRGIHRIDDRQFQAGDRLSRVEGEKRPPTRERDRRHAGHADDIVGSDQNEAAARADPDNRGRPVERGHPQPRVMTAEAVEQRHDRTGRIWVPCEQPLHHGVRERQRQPPGRAAEPRRATPVPRRRPSRQVFLHGNAARGISSM
jgi:hypothetical protein